MQEILNKIIEDCPNAWSEFVGKEDLREVKEVESVIVKNVHIQINYIYGNLSIYNFRSWYDYFDGLGIKVYIMFIPLINKFCAYIWHNGKPFKTGEAERNEAEWNGFYEAFKIREEQIK